MLRRRMMMTRAQGGVQLPAGYTPLEYIETDGNSYIDTFYNPNQNTRVVMKVSGFPNTSNAVLFGARTSYTSSDKFAFIASGNSVYRASFYNKDIELAASISYSGEMVVDQNKNTTYLNGSAVATAPTGAFSCPYTLHLFSFNNGGAPSGYCKVKFYYCQIYDNGVLVRDFIPCTNPDGISGLWDSVNNVFYKMLPADYTRLDFIESDGTTYIDTGFKPNNNTRVVMDVDIKSQSSYPKALFGARNGSTTSDASFIVWAITANGFRTDFGSKSLVTTVVPTGRFVIDKNKNVTTFNGIEYTNSAYTFQCDYNIGLFTQINVNGPDDRLSAAKLYSCQIYDNGTLVRDFIPAMNASGEAGLYDLKNDVWYALLPVAKPKVENKISVYVEGPIRNRKYGFDFQFPSASQITVTYKGWEAFGDSEYEYFTDIRIAKDATKTNVIETMTSSGSIADGTFMAVGRTIESIIAISPTEDDTYIYTF